MTDLLLVGRVARAHGNKGQVIVNPETDDPAARFAEGTALIVDQGGHAVERRIAAVRFQQGRPIVAFEGVDSIDAAEALAGADLKVRASDLAALERDTYYRHDLVGCDVADTSGRSIGRVSGVEGPKERSLLLVASTRGEIMIPMVQGIVVEVNPGARRIVVDPPEGLVDLNDRACRGARRGEAPR